MVAAEARESAVGGEAVVEAEEGGMGSTRAGGVAASGLLHVR